MMIEEDPEIINTQNYKNNEKAIKPQQNYYINATYKKTALLFDCYLWHVCQNGSDVIGHFVLQKYILEEANSVKKLQEEMHKRFANN